MPAVLVYYFSVFYTCFFLFFPGGRTDLRIFNMNQDPLSALKKETKNGKALSVRVRGTAPVR
jgi:hypothetical protein